MYRLSTKNYSLNDYFSWEFYEWFPKTCGNTELFFIGFNPIVRKKYTAWHTNT